MITAIVFDFDGVLANSEVLHLQAYQQVLSGRGAELSTPDYYSRYLGFDDEGVFATFAADHGLILGREAIDELIAQKAVAFEALEAGTTILFPGAEACVRRLAAEFPLGIASGAMRREIEAVLEQSGLRDCFAFIVASGDTPSSKPAPDPYLRAAELHGRPPAECLAIEDSKWGIESAQEAGMTCVGITQTYPRDEIALADHIIDSLDELTPETIRAMRP